MANMPTRRKPQLNHSSVRFGDLSDRIGEELRKDQDMVLGRLGFFREFGDPEAQGYTGLHEMNELLREIAGILTTAAAIRVDAGFKAPSRLIATLDAVAEVPARAFLDTLEPEAKGALAAAYQRFLEPPGTFWMDLKVQDENVRPPGGLVRAAASRAIATLKAQSSRGRRVEHDVHYLAFKLRVIFLRFNDCISRVMVLSSRGGGQLFLKEEGPFYLFLESVLTPLNRVLKELPSEGDILSRKMSAESIASARKQFATILRDVAVRREFVARARLLEKKIAAERRERDAQSRVAAALAECEKSNKETA
jgi:hypothetical protein